MISQQTRFFLCCSPIVRLDLLPLSPVPSTYQYSIVHSRDSSQVTLLRGCRSDAAALRLSSPSGSIAMPRSAFSARISIKALERVNPTPYLHRLKQQLAVIYSWEAREDSMERGQAQVL